MPFQNVPKHAGVSNNLGTLLGSPDLGMESKAATEMAKGTTRRQVTGLGQGFATISKRGHKGAVGHVLFAPKINSREHTLFDIEAHTRDVLEELQFLDGSCLERERASNCC
jgi:hypothetical protein